MSALTERDTRTLHIVSGGTSGATDPTWAIDITGNATFQNVNIKGQLILVGGGTLGTVMDNNEFLSGLTTGGAVKRLIGVNTSNVVSIDTDAAGVTMFGGQFTIASASYVFKVAGTSVLTVDAVNATFTTNIVVPNGSNGAPTITGSDNTTGLHFSAGRVAIDLAGVAKVFFDGTETYPVTDNAITSGSTANRWSNIFSVIHTIGTTGSIATSQSSMTDYAAAQGGTLLNAPVAGNPTKWVGFMDNGTLRRIPCW